MNSGVSDARAPPSCSRPSGPRTTDGSSGSDSRAFMCADGMRATVLAVIVLPSVAVVGAAAAGSAVPITGVVSVARARPRPMRDACGGATMAGWMPPPQTATVGPAADRRTVRIRRQRERAIGAGDDRRDHGVAVTQLHECAGQRQPGLINDDAAKWLGLYPARDQHACETEHSDGRGPEETWPHLSSAYKL